MKTGMETKKDSKKEASGSPPMSAANDLRGRQSVRTTFKLSEATIHAVSIVAAHLGIKQKSLFDHLMDDLNALGGIPAVRQKSVPPSYPRIQKTYVISRRSLEYLERIAKDFHTPRDQVVEISVQRLLPIIEAERLQHAKRKEVLADMKTQAAKAHEFLHKTELLLGENDPVTAIISSATRTMDGACQEVEEFVERSRIIEESLEDE